MLYDVNVYTLSKCIILKRVIKIYNNSLQFSIYYYLLVIINLVRKHGKYKTLISYKFEEAVNLLYFCITTDYTCLNHVGFMRYLTT
jgi:hypothetical protein